MQRQIDDLIEKNNFDLIHVQFIRMAQYVTKYSDKIKLLDSGDSFWLNLTRRSRLDRGLAWPLLKIEANRVKVYETEIARQFNMVTMVSKLDLDCLLSINKNLRLSLVPMGVDVDYFQKSSSEYESNLLFTGTIRYFPNKDAVLYFYNEIFPYVKNSISDVKFYVVGNYPPQNVVKLMSSGDVIVTGHVEDVRPYFDKSAVFVCPLRSGSGMQAKILEAMAMGVPVVTTSIGFIAFEGAVAGRDILVADDPESFAKEVIRLLRDKDLRKEIAENGRKLVEKRYNWPSIVNHLDSVYKRITTD
jgi:glycosyltransferase involved in cell wall biosynthesis